MLFWARSVAGGKRASDRPLPVAPVPARDELLEEAVAEGRISLVFQPQIEPESGKVAGVEALARWREEDCAQRLFERAANAGLSERLSRLVQRKALRAAGAWEGALRELRISINILPEDLVRPGYAQWLLDEVAECGIDPCRVTVEITESALLSDHEAISRRLARLRSAGLSVAIDDFGSGYANLSYLASLPLDALKIDRSLVAGIMSGAKDRIVIRAMIRLARELDLKLIVEGVESTAQLALLADWGCDLYQGFIGAGPLNEDELLRFVSVSDAQAA